MAIRIKGTRFVYFPAPKCGSTSLKHAILRHNDPAGFEVGKHEIHNFRDYWTPPWKFDWSRPWSHMNRRRLNPFLRRFCVVRDPIDKFVSAFRNQAVDNCGIARREQINEFATSIEQQSRSSEHLRYHFAPMVEFLGTNPAFYDRVFHIKDLADIPCYLGVPLNIPREETKGPVMSRADLTTEAIEHLRKFYAEDYATFGQFF